MPASSSLTRKRAAVPASKLKKLGATKLSEVDAKSDPNARGAPEPTPAFEPGTPSPTMISKRPAAASPSTPDRVQAPAAGALPPVTSRGADTKRRKRPKSSDPSMTRTSARPTTGTGALTAKSTPSPAVTLPKRDARHLAPPKTMNMAEWDDWGVSSVLDGVVGGFGLADPSDAASRARRGGDDASHKPRFVSERNANTREPLASPGKASLDAFVAATSAEAVSLVGRAALALGNAVVDGIEGTADFVQHAAKRADRIANKAASPTPGGRGVRDALGVLAPSGGTRRGSGAFPSDTGSPAKRTARGRGRDARVLGLGKDRSPLEKIRVGGGFRSPAKAARAAATSSAGAVPTKHDDIGDEWGWPAAASPTEDALRGFPQVSSAAARHRRELEASRAENATLREDLRGARAALAAAAEEAESLKRQNLGLQRRQAQRDREREGADPLAEQVRCQLETLVSEKAKLAQENDELWRENESLQELLMHSNMATEAESLYSAGGMLADLVEKAAPPQTHFESKLAEATEGFSESGSDSAATRGDEPDGDDDAELLDAVDADGAVTDCADPIPPVSRGEVPIDPPGTVPPSAASDGGIPFGAVGSTGAEPIASEPSPDASSSREDAAAAAATPAPRLVDRTTDGKENVDSRDERSEKTKAPKPAAEPKTGGGKKKKGKKGKR